MTRRKLLLAGAAAVSASAATVSAGALLRLDAGGAAAPAPPLAFEVTKSEDEWRSALSPEQFRILRGHGTERAGTSPLDREARPGVFACAGCGLPVYRSEHTFDSRTGWPSCFQPVADAVGTSEDWSLLGLRTEVHCRRCGGHLGHVFADGPPPTGLRHCINVAALLFQPA